MSEIQSSVAWKGNVLSSRLILKSEHSCPSTSSAQSSDASSVLGVPKWRLLPIAGRGGDTYIAGCGQPDAQGLQGLLRTLSIDHRQDPILLTWFSAREEPLVYINGTPYVLREHNRPFQNIIAYAGISGARLELLEEKLKEDVLNESLRHNGILTIYCEKSVAENDEKLDIVSQVIAVNTVLTPTELFQTIAKDEKHAKFQHHRVPLTRFHIPTADSYIDDYIKAFGECGEEKKTKIYVFSSGLGVGRTTFGMVIGTLIAMNSRKVSIQPLEQKPQPQLSKLKAMLEEECDVPRELAASDQMINALQDAWNNGNYHVIAELKRAINVDGAGGIHHQVNSVIDACSQEVNLRHFTLQSIFRYIFQSSRGSGDAELLRETALRALERYTSLVILAAYLQNTKQTGEKPTFKEWFARHSELEGVLESVRTRRGQYKPFRPVSDILLNVLALKKQRQTQHAIPSPIATTSVRSSENRVLRERSGTVLTPNTLLKEDHWTQADTSDLVAGAPNFKQVFAEMPVWSLAQPEANAVEPILHHINRPDKDCNNCVWINVREEPLVYIDGVPFVLRDPYASLRNIRVYSGISADRIERMEERLAEDLQDEAEKYENRQLLVHYESVNNSDGEDEEGPRQLNAKWISVKSVHTPKEVFSSFDMKYVRLPVTSEDAWGPSDIDCLVQLMIDEKKNDCETAFIFNDQMGTGRCIQGAILAAQILQWANGETIQQLLASFHQNEDHKGQSMLAFRVVHSVLRLIHAGLECKRLVDRLIERSGSDMLSIILQEPTTDLRSLRKSVGSLKRYFVLLLVQAWLVEHSPPCKLNLKEEAKQRMTTDEQEDELVSEQGTIHRRPSMSFAPSKPFIRFSDWLSRHEAITRLFQSITREHALDRIEPSQILLPSLPQQQDGDGDGSEVALSSEVWRVVKERTGSVLATMTILKEDFFPGCQLPQATERIAGAPNFRKVTLDGQGDDALAIDIYGVGMPTQDAIDRVLDRVLASNQNQNSNNTGIGAVVAWICLREEPVIFLHGVPYVLRVVQDPVVNVEMTGIISDQVEALEDRLRRDCVQECRRYSGHLLLHGEECGGDGGSTAIVGRWRRIESKVQTPKQAWTTDHFAEKNRVQFQYHRIPITDEQAPLVTTVDRLLSTIDGYLSQAQAKTAKKFIFSCQMGRGRTTTGMVVACMIIKAQSPAAIPVGKEVASEVDKFTLIQSLLRVLPDGRKAKALTDACIDTCALIQNIREAILAYREKDEERAKHYLLRYAALIVLGQYLFDRNAPDSRNNNLPSYSVWFAERTEIRTLLAANRTLS